MRCQSIPADVYDLNEYVIYIIYIYKHIRPPCLWHIWRVVLTACLLCWNSYRDPFTAVPEFLLDLHPPARNPSGILAESVGESARFWKELTESQLFQWSKYPGNLQNTTTLRRNPQFGLQMSPLGAPAGTKNQTQIHKKFNSTNTAKEIASRSPNGDPKAIRPTPPKLTSSPVLERHPVNKIKKSKSVQYLQCFEHIQALPKTQLFVNVWVPN